MPTKACTAPPVIRRPAVAGYYYPQEAAALRRALTAHLPPDIVPEPAVAAIVPHGSLRHCGAVTGAVLGRIAVPRRCIIIGPSHAGSPLRWSVLASGSCRTPLGDVPVDAACADALLARCDLLSADPWAHTGEHAVEVVLPWLQQLGPPDLTVVPVVTASDEPDECHRVAQALAQVIRLQEEPVLLIASSDWSHFEPAARAVVLDAGLLDAVQALDAGRLMRRVREQGLIMCGANAVACVLEAAAALGAARAEVVRYGTSAEAGGDPAAVTGYAGVMMRKDPQTP